MEFRTAPTRSGRIPRPAYAWLAAIAAVFTGIAAIPVGLLFLGDPTGAAMGIPQGWIEATPFGSYFIPGLYLLLINGVGMLILAVLIVLCHWSAPWLSAILGVGLITWILVQLLVMPETILLQWLFLAVGLLLGFVALLWLRATGQFKLW